MVRGLRGVTLAIAVGASIPAWAQALTGRQVFDSTCHVCHSQGVAGAPRFADPAEWSKHLKKGITVLDKHAIDGYYGYSFMPPKGGNESLTDGEVRAAVRYMVAAASGVAGQHS
ncbi:MAG: c-type cytochrome [Acidiferrobacter sp.]